MDIIEVSSDDQSSEVEPQSNDNGGVLAVFGQGITKRDIESKAVIAVIKNNAQHVKEIKAEESFVQRRVSPRLQQIPKSKRPFYGTLTKKSHDVSKDEFSNKKTKFSLPKVCKDATVPKDGIDTRNTNVLSISVGGGSSNCSFNVDEEKTIASSSPANVVDSSVYTKVKEKLKIFNKYYLHFVQEEEKRCHKEDVNDSKGSRSKKGVASGTNVKRLSKRPDLKAISKKGVASGTNVKRPHLKAISKKGVASGTNVKRSSKRPDLKTISKMLKTNANLFSKKIIGHIPGIDVGHQFFFRAEMVAVGLHGHWLYGIDCMTTSSTKSENYKGYTLPLAVAIVLSGQYEDDLDKAEDVIYTGQGGNDLLGNKRQVKDQIMKRGNLALKNNMDQSVPVRFIRGHKSVNSHSGKVYTYDGLYKVVEYWREKGVRGFTVYKYRLKRIKGQPTLTTNQVLFARGRVCKVASELQGLVCSDISQGQEDICIPVTNLFDDPRVAPEGFTYSKSIQVAENVKLPSDAPGCKCKENCTNPKTCSCARLNGSDFPYVAKDGGRLIKAQEVVYECGPSCGCGPSCVNRTSQKGPKFQLEVFRTTNKGWAVRSWDSIPSGAPVCEYIGVLKRCDELDSVSENDYIFEIDLLQTIKEIGGRERQLRDVFVPTRNHVDKDSESAPEFCIDAGSIGNVARFINHSCEPNLFVQCVFSSHHDARFARVILFAAENIPPLQELTYDYNYALDSVVGSDGKIKKLPCHCGAACCRKRLY